MKHTRRSLLLILLLFSLAGNLGATQEAAEIFADKQAESATVNIELENLQTAIAKKQSIVKQLEKSLGKSGENPELEKEILAKRQEVLALQKSFEQVAIGGIDVGALKGNTGPRDWREELTIVVKPLLENLSALTEKPRKIEGLKRKIELQKQTVLLADQALAAIEKKDLTLYSAEAANQIGVIKAKWLETKSEAESDQVLASYQLKNLNGNTLSWYDTVKINIVNFAQERGLTLFLALLSVLLILYLSKGVRWLLDRNKSGASKSEKTTYRVIAYGQKLITFILIVVSVMVVFFSRGDVLLMAIMLIFIVSIALALKNIIPQFVTESRLLLNIGPVRESEQVIYNGVPWKVSALNMYSTLTNPCIQGTLRLPLAELKSLISRPKSSDRWFPSVVGDWVRDSDGGIFEVIKQSPSAVELQSGQRTRKLIPTGDYYSAGYTNLTDSGLLRLTTGFGIDYKLQDIALDTIPEKFQHEIVKRLSSLNLDAKALEVKVEFQKAGESSLDYLVIVLADPADTKFYYQIERAIQQACVKVCNEKDWGIPFPQLTVHHQPSK